MYFKWENPLSFCFFLISAGVSVDLAGSGLEVDTGASSLEAAVYCSALDIRIPSRSQ